MTNDNSQMQGIMSTDQQAIEWMARNLSGTMLPDETHQFELWLEEPDNQAAYDKLAKAAAGADTYADQLLAESFEDELHALDEHRSGQPWLAPALSALAATLLVAVTTGFFLLSSQDTQTIRYATIIGDRELVPLEDGSTIMLNTATQVDVTYEADQRNVALVGGEAFFNVAQDPSRKFAVTTTHGVITVTGTSFNVRSTDIQTSVYVFSGAVEVRLDNQEMVTLLAGEAVTFNAGLASLEKEDFDATRVLSWRTGRINFEDAPLIEVVDELNRYFPVPFKLSANAPDDAPVTGEFDITDQLTVTRGLSIALSLEVVRQPDHILLTMPEIED